MFGVVCTTPWCQQISDLRVWDNNEIQKMRNTYNERKHHIPPRHHPRHRPNH